MQDTIENFDETKLKSEEFYKSLAPIHCPYFQEKIYFNTQGIEHLKFKSHGKARNRHDQYMRFKLLHYVPEILGLSKTVQGIFHANHFERVRMHSRTDTVLKPVSYYEFIAVLRNIRIKVIVKKIENSQLFFWSIIPFWGVNKMTNRRKLYTGDPEED